MAYPLLLWVLEVSGCDAALEGRGGSANTDARLWNGCGAFGCAY